MVSGSLALLFFLLGFHEGGRASGMAGWASDLAGWASGLAGWTNERTENLSILLDFVPYRVRCPASPMKTKEK